MVYGTETVYSELHDMTFIMKETYNDTAEIIKVEVVGFYYGEPDDKKTEMFYGELVATF